MKWFAVLLLVSSSLTSELSSQEKAPISNYQALFSPEDHLADELISMIDKERKSIKIAVYHLTHRGIVKALTQAKERGVAIEVIVDSSSLRAKTVLAQMKKASFSVFVWSPEEQFKQLSNGKQIKKKKPLMHDKFCVFGEDRVWTGSFNFTLDASLLHQENVLVVESKQIATSYLSEFEKIKKSHCLSLAAYQAKELSNNKSKRYASAKSPKINDQK